MTGRQQLLTYLADHIQELTRPRDHTEYVEQTVVEERPSANGRRRKAKRTRRRRAHHVTLPPLLEALTDALVPGSSGEPGAPAGFESRPAAELEPAAVLRQISDDVTRWARLLGVRRSGLSVTLTGLVSARHTDEQLAALTVQAGRWVQRAKEACGEEAAPLTLADACPYCWAKNALVVTGDLKTAKCTRCGTRWSVDTIGLLADMLRANQEREVLAVQRCCWPNCSYRGDHEVHGDGAGRLFRDRCRVDEKPAPAGGAGGRLSA